EESIEGTDARLIFAEADIGAIAAEDVRLRHWQWNAGFTRISEHELARLDRPAPSGRRLHAAALDRRLIDAVLVTERIEIVCLRAEVLTGQHPDARELLELFVSDREHTAPPLLGIAERAQSDVHVTRAERPLPVLRVVGAVVSQLPGSRRHPGAECLG